MVQIASDQLLSNGLSWIGGVVALICSAIGLSGIIMFLIKHYIPRFSKHKDDRDAIHATNQSKQIDADTSLRTDLMERIDKLEAKIDQLQLDVISHMKENVRLAAENEWLKRDNTRLEEEISQLRKDRRSSDLLISDLRVELNSLKLRFEVNSNADDLPKPPV